MTAKKRKSGVSAPSWSSCGDCNAIISNKHVTVHKEKSCPPDRHQWTHPFILDGSLYSTCEIFQTKPIFLANDKNFGDFSQELKNEFVFVPPDVLQISRIPLGDEVLVSICTSGHSVQMVKKAWSAGGTDSGFGVHLSAEVADLYDLKKNSQTIISKIEGFSPAKSVTVVCESDVGCLDKGKLLFRLKSQNQNKIYCISNRISLKHYGSKIIFKVVSATSFAETLTSVSFYLITKETKWSLKEAEEEDEEKPRNSLMKLGGLSSVVEDVKDVISLALSTWNILSDVTITRGVLIYGPPGTGKTTLAEGLAHQFTDSIVHVCHSKILSKIVGETEKELKNLFDLAKLTKPSVILIDDLDVLCGKSNSASEYEKRITGMLCLLMDELSRSPEASVAVLGTTSKIHDVDERLRSSSRFGKEVEIHVPGSAQRFEILESLLTDVGHCLNELELRSVSDCLHGFVGADIVSLVSKAVLRNHKRSEGKEKLGLDDFHWALARTKPSAMKEITMDIPNVKWDDIAGQEDLKLKLKQCIDWPLKHGGAFAKLGITPPKGVLMFGPPGCSKTMIAKAVATESNLNFISVKGPELFSKWVGESERAVREVFRRARQAAPSVVFFDELDAIGGERNVSTGSNVQERVLAQLLTELDGVECLDNVTVMAATNRIDRIDPALMRPGRLDRIIYVPLPDRETRKEIFRLRLGKTRVEKDVDVDELVKKSEGYSGAEVMALCREASLKALEEDLEADKLTRKHFMDAFAIVIPRTPKSLLEVYDRYLLK